jgi:transcriptional regulator with XRE-family HTH domain
VDYDEAERARILLMIKTLLTVLEITNREVEQRLGQSTGYLSRLFSGSIDLKVSHILAICRALQLRPAEFFHFVYPAVPTPPSPSARYLQENFLIPTPAEEPVGVSSMALATMIDEAVRRFLGSTPTDAPPNRSTRLRENTWEEE